MEFNIDPKDLNLQDAAGMQLVEVIRNLADESGTTDYEDLENLPKINGVTLVGDKSSDDLHIAVSDEQVTEAVDAWLEDNVAQETGYVLDSTLTMSNAAAPADKVGELKSVLEDVTDTELSRNLLPINSKSATVNDVSCSYSDGSLTMNGTGSANGGRLTAVTDNFVIPAGTYTFSRNNGSGPGIILETGSTILAQLLGTTVSASFTVAGSTTCYIGISVEKDVAYDLTQKLQLESGSEKTSWQEPSYELLTAVDIVARSEINEIGLPYDTPELTWTAGKAFIFDAGWVDNTGYSYADVELIQGQSLIIKLSVSTLVFPLSLWDKDGSYIIKACFPRPAENGVAEYTYSCESDSELIRINVVTSAKENVEAKVYKPNNLVNISNIKAENKNNSCFDVLHANVIAIGDSLTQGSYTGNDLHSSQSYPTFLAKLMNNTVENAGRGGWGALDWWTGDETEEKGFPYCDFSDMDSAVICLGTNGGLTDTLDTDVTPYEDYLNYADTNTGAYCKIIEGMKAQNEHINIILCNIWGGDTVAVTNSVINKIATKYNLQVVDLYSEFFTKWGAYNAQQYNLHLGRIGYARMAGLIKNALEDDVMLYPERYNFIP